MATIETSVAMIEPLVLVPDKYGVAIVDMVQFLDRLMDGDTVDEAIANSAVDSAMDPAELFDHHLPRVRAYNETGNIDAYWAPVE